MFYVCQNETNILGPDFGTTDVLTIGVFRFMMRGGVCASDVCFAPFRFTGKERDTESGNDCFGARYSSSEMGRFMSPDWSAKAEPVPYAKLDNPQSLNLYAYLSNNPLMS